jgi:hypothetical protein
MPVITDTREAEIRKIAVRDQPGQKVSETPSQKQAGYGDTHYNPGYAGGICRKITAQDWPQAKSARSYPKNN